ncbi:histone-fold-containing protein [Mycena alexandri]|uniref:Histone-fold-containing protein n=1 Tax=Mycena alexandri TaxID=1745969 RepID=A0AAD6S3Q1_9AGAR|nr:histone-fold-containing protein [Mycena alexandri]
MLKKMKRDFRDMDELPVSTARKAPASTAGKEPAQTEAAKAGKKTVTKKAAAPAANGEKTARRPTRRTSTRVHPDTGISNKAMAILNSFVNDILSVSRRKHPLAQYSKKSTPDFGLNIKPCSSDNLVVGNPDQRTSHLPGELAKHAISEGTKSVTNFSSAATTK